jgi:hypothetical protein
LFPWIYGLKLILAGQAASAEMLALGAVSTGGGPVLFQLCSKHLHWSLWIRKVGVNFGNLRIGTDVLSEVEGDSLELYNFVVTRESNLAGQVP